MKTINTTSQKSILFTVDVFHISGVLTLNRQYIHVLHSQGYKTIIMGRQGNVSNPKKYFPNSAVYVIPGNMRESLVGRILDGVSAIMLLHKVYDAHAITCIHMSTPWSSLYALLHPKTWRLKRIITFHGAYDLESKSARVGKQTVTNILGDFVRYCIQSFSLQTSHIIVCCSLYSKKLVQTHFKLRPAATQRIITIPGYAMTTDDRSLYPAVPNTRLLRMLNIGRAEPRKGVHILLQACSMLRQRHIPFMLSVASPIHNLKTDHALDYYEQSDLFSSVRFYHAADTKEKQFLLSNADVFVVPSQELETFGLTILESLSHGVPVIGTPTGAIPEILQNVDARLITSGVSATDLTKTLVWFSKLSDRQRIILKEKSLACVRTLYSYEAIRPKIISIYYVE